MAAYPLAPGFYFADVDLGIFFILAMSSTTTIGVVMAGWSSNSKWSLYGSMREAAQVVAYEILLATRATSPDAVRGGIPLASALEMERFFAHLEQVLEEIEFRDRTGEGHLMARLRRFFSRAVPDQNEINILRGILTSVQGRRRRAGEPHAPRVATGTAEQGPSRRSSS